MAILGEHKGAVEHPRRVAVIGAGYVGIPTALLLSHFGHQVVLAERDDYRRTTMQDGRSPIIEEDLEELLRSVLETQRLRIIGDAAEAVVDAEFVFLCVNTPMGIDGHADLSFIDAACAQIKDHLMPGAVVINKSTVPVGTTIRVAAAIGRSDVAVVSNPEFLREGTAVRDSFGPDRTVVGGDDQEVAATVGGLFALTGAPLVVTDAATAELIKYAANTFLTTKLSFINAMSQLCDALGANAVDLVRGIGHDPRIGFSFLNPGPGWGGPCLPKDSHALVAIAETVGEQIPLISAAIETNHRQQRHIVQRVRELAGGSLEGARIAVLGLTFKANTGDRRDSPALVITKLLREAGAEIAAYDPTVPVDATDDDVQGLNLCASVLDAARDARVLLILTEWNEFRELDFDVLGGVMAQRTVFDGRNILDLDIARSADFVAWGIGRS